MHLIQANAPLPYITEQLGHSSIQITVDTYGRWLPTGNKELVDRLDRTPAEVDRAAREDPQEQAVGDQSVTNSPIVEIPFPQLIDSAAQNPLASDASRFTPI